MNQHFSRGDLGQERYERPDRSIPLRGYGRIDHVESLGRDSDAYLVAVDLVDADWIDRMAQLDDRFSFDNPEARIQAWRAYSEQLAGPDRPTNPFNSAPIFRLEVEVASGGMLLGVFEIPAKPRQDLRDFMNDLEGRWIELHEVAQVVDDDAASMLYAGLFSEPVSVRAKGTLPSAVSGRALSDIFSLDHLPSISKKDVERVLANAQSDALAIYDVGQGNANALIGEIVPSLYYDLGAGVYRNQKTTPPNLCFCFTHQPVIILSHWDADHWAGAYATKVNSIYPALRRDWIAPLQVVGPVHIAFAHDIVCSGGSLYIYIDPAGVVGSARTASGHLASFTVGCGSDKNGSGIVLTVQNEVYDGDSVSWLLTGDCDYHYFMSALNPSPPVGLVAPHHGADLHGGSSPPSPADSIRYPYHRLVYSFGKDNTHGSVKVRHPTQAGVLAHQNADWKHNAAWLTGATGSKVDLNGDILATCEHSPSMCRDGVIVGWMSAPSPLGTPCGGSSCTLHVGSS